MSDYTSEVWAAIKEEKRDEQRYGRPVAYSVQNSGPSRDQRRHPERYTSMKVSK